MVREFFSFRHLLKGTRKINEISYTWIRALMCLVIAVSIGGGRGRDAACERAAEVAAAAGVAAEPVAEAVAPWLSPPPRCCCPAWLVPPLPPPPPTRPVLSMVISCQPEGEEESARLFMPSPSEEEEEEEEAEAEKERRRKRRSSAIDDAFSLLLPPPVPAPCALASLLEPRASRSIISALFLKGRRQEHSFARAAKQPAKL